MLKVAARHLNDKALDIMSREIYPAATAMAQGIGGIFGGRPKVQPVMRLFSFLVDKSLLSVSVHFEGKVVDVPAFVPPDQPSRPASQPTAVSTSCTPAGPTNMVRLVDLAYARSGDKGDASNIAVIARRPEYAIAIAEQLTPDAVAEYMSHVAKGPVRRYDWPGLHGFNFMLERALGGGGVASLRYDPQGKGHAQMLLEFPVRVPATWGVVAQ